jgi:hypothetical protein
MRRRAESFGPVPERLARYVPSEWPGGPREWKAAALGWLEANPGRRLPFGEFGDGLDVVRVAVRYVREPLPPIG